MSGEGGNDAAKLVEKIVLDIIQPKSPGMGNPPCHLWDTATDEGVALLIASRLLKRLEAAGYALVHHPVRASSDDAI